MFSQVSVCPTGGVCWDTLPPSGPEADTLPGVDTPSPGADNPAVQAGRYEQQAGGTHPTGMHTCFEFEFSYYNYND